MRNRLFEIVTLSDKQYNTLNDPVSVITGGIALLSSLFPNIFGGGRKRLTESDYVSLLPGAGYWTTRLRSHLARTIHYDVDWITNVQPFTAYFADDNKAEICGGCPNNYAKLLELLRTESQTGGTSPIGVTPGGYGGTLDYSTLIPIAIGGVVLALIMKKNKSKK